MMALAFIAVIGGTFTGAATVEIPAVVPEKTSTIFPTTAVQQSIQISKELLLISEHPAEIVAGAGREGTDRNILEQRGAVHAFIEGPVSTAGVDPQFLAAGRVAADLVDRVQRSARHIDFIIIAPALPVEGTEE